MKRLLLLTIVVAAAISILVGCVGEINTYTDSGRSIDINVDQQFVIALGANPTTGYTWQTRYEEGMLKLMEKTYEPTDEPADGKVGSGGIEYFHFKAVKKGQTEVTLIYQRPGEETTPQDETKIFTINIK